MQIVRHHQHVPPAQKGAVFAVGNFDGVHKGHQKVIAIAAERARQMKAPLGVLVFEPHPRRFFFPDEPFFRLTPFRSKTKLLQALGVDLMAALPFDADMAGLSPQEFVHDVLVSGLGASHLVVGFDFRFGKGRAGDPDALTKLSKAHRVETTIVEPVTHDAAGEVYSSSRIRELLGKGDPRAAADLLGHWWSVESQVIKGDQRGRTIGFPTANLALADHVEPALGVYAVLVTVEDGPHKGIYDGVANLGRRPTFDKRDVLLEAHLFDFTGDLYGRHVAVSFIDFIRPERKFDGLESLKAQITKDSGEARARLAKIGKNAG